MSDQCTFGFDQQWTPYGVRTVARPDVPPEAQKRLRGQSLAILERLQLGPATNRELSDIALKYTSRITDLRIAGYNVKCVEHDKLTGKAVYKLVEEK